MRPRFQSLSEELRELRRQRQWERKREERKNWWWTPSSKEIEEQQRERERQWERERERPREWEREREREREREAEREWREWQREQREREQREQERLLRQAQLRQQLEAPPGACPGGLSLNHLSSLKIHLTFFSVSARVSGSCSRACGVVYVPWITGYHSGVFVAHYRACGNHAIRWRSFRVHATRGRPPRHECSFPAGLRDQDEPATGSIRFSAFSLDTDTFLDRSHACRFYIVLYLIADTHWTSNLACTINFQ
ncbi:hypothetical protein DFH09DRAFT_1146288 [Mycena vulgaris]|nr:hypothetical protein DFH09DRAFT_1146288 [Mycena vulgaris]